eukprot:TRINITY_DN67437_c9_g3_i1.p1 TRINITY_DN67437_c9_g3~~TRINITY_DN67437_c9_g3_i1.p1  ORF type:complete len:619 (+),score=62.68 TRINITY_DN67437_c9_g3_i1:56-1912(+)
MSTLTRVFGPCNVPLKESKLTASTEYRFMHFTFTIILVLGVLKWFYHLVSVGSARKKFRTYKNPEDAVKNHGFVGEHPNVTRAVRIHQNSSENLPLFLVIGYLTLMTAKIDQADDDKWHVIFGVAFILWFVTRLIHFFAHLKAKQPMRTGMYLLGQIVVLFIGLSQLIKWAKPWDSRAGEIGWKYLWILILCAYGAVRYVLGVLTVVQARKKYGAIGNPEDIKVNKPKRYPTGAYPAPVATVVPPAVNPMAPTYGAYGFPPEVQPYVNYMMPPGYDVYGNYGPPSIGGYDPTQMGGYDYGYEYDNSVVHTAYDTQYSPRSQAYYNGGAYEAPTYYANDGIYADQTVYQGRSSPDIVSTGLASPPEPADVVRANTNHQCSVQWMVFAMIVLYHWAVQQTVDRERRTVGGQLIGFGDFRYDKWAVGAPVLGYMILNLLYTLCMIPKARAMQLVSVFLLFCQQALIMVLLIWNLIWLWRDFDNLTGLEFDEYAHALTWDTCFLLLFFKQIVVFYAFSFSRPSVYASNPDKLKNMNDNDTENFGLAAIVFACRYPWYFITCNDIVRWISVSLLVLYTICRLLAAICHFKGIQPLRSTLFLVGTLTVVLGAIMVLVDTATSIW